MPTDDSTPSGKFPLRLRRRIRPYQSRQRLVSRASADTQIAPGNASLVLSTFAPIIAIRIAPAAVTLVTSGKVPVLAKGLLPGKASLVLATSAPVVAKGIVPAKASLITSTFAPVLAFKLSPAVRALTLTTFTPALTITQNIAIAPDAATLTLSTFAPIVTGDAVIAPVEPPKPPTGELGHVVSDTGRRLRFPIAPDFQPVTVRPAAARLTLATFAPIVAVAEGPVDVSEVYMALYAAGSLSDEEFVAVLAA